MADNTDKKKVFLLSGILSLLRRDSSRGAQIRRLREEMGRNASEIELLLQDADRLKKEAGFIAYDFWKAGELKADSLNVYFESVKNREEGITKQNQLVEALGHRIEQLQDKRLGIEDRAALLQISVADMASGIVKEMPSGAIREDFPFVCPSCGAHFEKPANFCRYCGAGMKCLEIETNMLEIESERANLDEVMEGEGMSEEERVAATGEERVEEEEMLQKEEAPEEEKMPEMKELSGRLIVETERLLLRTMTEADFDALCSILRDAEVMYAYEHAFDEEEVRAWLWRQQERYRKDGFGLWAVVLKESGDMIGQCGITMQDAGEKQVMEIGYLFARDFWHRGYAAEAALACRRYAFEELKAEEVYSIIREGNHASERVADKNGMNRCGLIVKHYYDMDMPHNIYRITRKEWERITQTDSCAYQMGIIDCFNEMVHAGLKRIAMSHPCKTKEERDSYLDFCDVICGQYGTLWYAEDEAFLTDLFPEALNKDTYNIIFYRLKSDLDAYLALKGRKTKLVAEGRYEGNERYRIAFEFGKLLSYTEEAIYRKICETTKGMI